MKKAVDFIKKVRVSGRTLILYLVILEFCPERSLRTVHSGAQVPRDEGDHNGGYEREN